MELNRPVNNNNSFHQSFKRLFEILEDTINKITNNHGGFTYSVSYMSTKFDSTQVFEVKNTEFNKKTLKKELTPEVKEELEKITEIDITDLIKEGVIDFQDKNFILCIIRTDNRQNMSFVMYPQIFFNNESINKSKKRLMNIINDLFFLIDYEYKIPLGSFTKEFEEFKSRSPKLPKNNKYIAFSNIFINNHADIVDNSGEKIDNEISENINFYRLVQNFFNNSLYLNEFVKYVIESNKKRKYRGLGRKICINKDILDKELSYGYNFDTFNRLKIVVQFKLIDGENEQKFDEIYLSSGVNDIKNESGIKVDQPGKVEEKIVELINNCNVSKQRYLVINIHLKFEDSVGHANNLIFDLRNNRVTRIEPHSFGENSLYDKMDLDYEIKTLVNNISYILDKNLVFINTDINISNSYKNLGIQAQGGNQGICWVITCMITIMIIMHPKFTPMTINDILHKNAYENFEVMFFRFFEFMKIIKIKVSFDLTIKDKEILNSDMTILTEFQKTLTGIYLNKNYKSLLWHKINSCKNVTSCHINLDKFYYIAMVHMLKDKNTKNDFIFKNLNSFQEFINESKNHFFFYNNLTRSAKAKCILEGENITCHTIGEELHEDFLFENSERVKTVGGSRKKTKRSKHNKKTKRIKSKKQKKV